MKNVLFALQSGFEPMVVRMIDLTTELVYVVREYVAEHRPVPPVPMPQLKEHADSLVR